MQIESSPYHYDSHVQLIQLLRQLGDLDKARQARRNMSKSFPLSEGMYVYHLTERECRTVAYHIFKILSVRPSINNRKYLHFQEMDLASRPSLLLSRL